jgi:hypothetical protein
MIGNKDNFNQEKLSAITEMECESSDIPNAKEFSIAFACAVTKHTMNQHDCIAKKGDESVFALMSCVFPMVSSDMNNWSQTGLSIWPSGVLASSRIEIQSRYSHSHFFDFFFL